MRRRVIRWSLVLSVLFALAVPASASALMFVRVEQDARTGLRTLVIDSGAGPSAITVTQETEGTLPGIGVRVTDPNEGFVIGSGCNTARNPPRARCSTEGVQVISMNLRNQDAPAAPPDDNSVNLTGVSQLTPDGSEPLPARITGGTGADNVTAGDRRRPLSRSSVATASRSASAASTGHRTAPGA